MKNISKTIKISRPLYKYYAGVSLLILLGALLEQATPLISKFIIDEIVLQLSNQSGDLSKLSSLIIIGFVASLLGIALTAVSNKMGDKTSAELMRFLTEKFYNKVLTLPQTYFDSEISGKIVHQLNRGINNIKMFSNTATNFILPTLLQTIFTIGVLAYYNWQIALYIAMLFPIYITISYFSTKRWGKYEKIKNELEDYNRGRIQEVVSNIKLVKTFNNQLAEIGQITKNQIDYTKAYGRQTTEFHAFDFLRNLSLIIVLLLINIIVFINTFQGTISISEMVLIVQLVALSRRPLFATSFILSQLQTAESGSKEFLEIMELKSTEEINKEFDYTKLTNPEIEFKDVAFNYEGKDNALEKVNLRFEPNQKVALIGHSGAGKSTIINLILKLYKPNSGSILLNGKGYNNLDHQYIRNNISLVFQENELFSTTIRENVAYGKPNATDEEVIRALKEASAFDFVQKLKEGINTKIGERGVKLSGGQRQRVQLARAFLHNSPILILDEATSSLDSKAEQSIQQVIEKLMEKKLVIIIAHRFSTIQNVDKVFVINDGKVVDSGTPKELSTREGIYSELLKYQIDGNKKLLENFEIF